MDQFPGDDQFSIKTQGIGTVLPEEELRNVLSRTVKEYEQQGFRVESQPNSDSPSAVVIKPRTLLRDVKYEVTVNQYGSVRVEEI